MKRWRQPEALKVLISPRERTTENVLTKEETASELSLLEGRALKGWRGGNALLAGLI